MSQDSRKAGKPMRLGKYEVLGRIGKGGMGAVYRAIDTDLQRLVALKVLAPEMADKPGMLERFRREARNAAKLRHENIVSIYEIGEQNGTVFLALEYVEGKDLHDYVTARGKLSPEEARDILLQAAHALDHAHREGVVHRDIKPSNFLISNAGGKLLVKLADMGLALYQRDEEARLTRDHTTVGTIDYMAPEQAQNSRAADIRSDIYALGCTLYHMLAGHAPFPRGSIPERIIAHMKTQPPDIEGLNDQVPPDLARVLKKMMAKRPRERYQTPAEIVADLESPDIHLKPLDSTPSAERATLRPEAKKPSTEVSTPASTPVPATEEIESPRKAKGKKRFRDEPRSGKRKSARGLQIGLGIGGVAIAALIVWFVTRPSEPAGKDPGIKSSPSPIGPIAHVKDDDEKKTEKKDESSFVGPPAPTYPVLYIPSAPIDPPVLRKEFGTEAPFPKPTADAVIIPWKRAAGGKGAPTLAAALKRAGEKAEIVIEIHDNGPLWIPSQPEIKNRSIHLRAAPGYRPLLALDVGTLKTEKDKGSSMLTFQQGRLVLEGVDVAVKWDGDSPGPHAVFRLEGASFFRDCTFSIARRGPSEVRLIQSTSTSPVEVRLQQSYIRGLDFTPLVIQGSTNVSIENSLIAASTSGSLIHFVNQGNDQQHLRLFRSTLIASRSAVTFAMPADKVGLPSLKVRTWDSLLTCGEVGASQADLLTLTGAAKTDQVHWKAINTLYAGWKRLLVSPEKTIGSGSIAGWRSQWLEIEGDQEVIEPWPTGFSLEPYAVSADHYRTMGSPVAFDATSGAGPLGCEIGRLPPGPFDMFARTYERYPVPTVPGLDDGGFPIIPTFSDGKYHGEKLDLTKLDLGAYLASVLSTKPAGPKVVLYLTGKGTIGSSPVKLTGVPHLVLVFEPGKGKDDLVLSPKSAGVKESGLIDMEGGTLEIINGRFHFPDIRSAVVPACVIRVRDGKLKLRGCTLHGPHERAPDAFQALIRIESAMPDAEEGEKAQYASIQDCVLHSHRTLIDIHGSDLAVRIKNSVLLAGEDAIGVHPADRSMPRLFLTLENNTLAVRKNAFKVNALADGTSVQQPVVIQASHNFFLDPYADAPRRSALLSIPAEELSQGRVIWQGKNNGMEESRWGNFWAEAGERKMKASDWHDWWGSLSESGWKKVEPAATAKTFAPESPLYDRLLLPPALRPVATMPPPYGADLGRLGLIRKKG